MDAFCTPSLLPRTSLGGHTAAAQSRLPQTYRASECRTVAAPGLVEAFRLPSPQPPGGNETHAYQPTSNHERKTHLRMFVFEGLGIIFGLVMDGWQALFQRSNRPLAMAWQAGVGSPAVAQWTHGSKFQPHTAAGYQNAKPDRSRFRASLGTAWGKSPSE